MRREAGFSTLKMLFWLAVIGAAGRIALAVGDVYYTEMKIQQIFDGVARHMVAKTASEIRAKMPEFYSLNGIQPGALPQEYYNNLLISTAGNKVRISSEYHVAVWLIGPPEGVNSDAGYDGAGLKGLDKVRARFRMDFDFSPSSETP